MAESRNRLLDLLALGLLALNLFLAIALFSFDAADPPSSLIYPANQQASNFCGPLGAFVARAMYSLFGLGAIYVLLSSCALNYVLFSKRSVTQPMLRFNGWLLTLLGICTLCGMALSSAAPGPIIGSGGYLGATGQGVLATYFAPAGAYILAISVVVGGLLLCTDYFVFKLTGRSVAASGRAMGQLVARRRRSSDEEELEYEEEEEEEEAPVVRVKRRKKTKHVTAASEDDEEETAEHETEEPQTKVRGGVASLLRIKNRNTRKAEREEVIEQLEAASRVDDDFDYELPSMDLLADSESSGYEEQEKDVRRKAQILERTFENFGFNIRVVEIETGPVIAQFEVELEAGLRLSRITNLADDIAVALRVPSVRIVAPIPGKNTVGIEVPNAERELVRLREVMTEGDETAARAAIPMYLGKDVSGNPMIADLTTLPHLLIAGRTGTGKSVCLNTLIMSMLMTRRPDEIKLLLIDPKMVELTPYARLPHLMHPVVTDMKKAEAILAWAVDKMEERYSLLMRAGVRHMSVYNQLGEEELYERMQPETDEEWEAIPKHLPYIVIVADEMADLMMTAPKEVESHIIRLAQKSRAVGIHLILATQKPTVDVITGLIKSNLPARISFQVASRTDSRVVLDEMGADKLLGNGDMLFLWPGTSTLLRGQGAYVSDDEIRDVVNFVAAREPQFVTELVQLKVEGEEGAQGVASQDHRDELYNDAVEVVVREGRGSVSLLQRALGIGYGRAARLIDYMSEDGIVGPYNGSQAREVTISAEEWAASQVESREKPVAKTPSAVPAPAGRKSNKLVLAERAPLAAVPAPWEENGEKEDSEYEEEYEEEEFEEEEYDEEPGDEEEYEDDEYEEEYEDEEYEDEEEDE
ncbi:MAG: DNA translocase FtsK [Pirellulales bacterium]|nr:DNA translocase FtsK [Pirellulales bacterium]